MAPPIPYTQADFAHSPFVVFYEVTRACDLLCKHCRACAQTRRHPQELTSQQSQTLISQIADFPKRPVLVFTGGDPMKREDIFTLIRHAVNVGLQAAMTPSATPLVTTEAVRGLQEAGLSRLALSLDAADAATHDAFRGVPGSFARTMEILADARAIGLPLQINTTITQRNVHQVEAMAEMLSSLGIVLWSVFFLIPVGRGRAEQRIAPEQYEEVFAQLWEQAQRQPYAIKTTEAHHYRRFVLQRQGDPQRQPGGSLPGRIQRAPIGVNDGKGVMFISHTGSIYPSGFLPIRCGKFPAESVQQVYQESPLFQALRDPDRLKGKCGDCEYRAICSGSRARAYGVTGDPLAAEPDCVYIPQAWKERALCSV
ncbi:MAG TPA: TIGR04053 family radical SAM/SPASM domain-containing protein [Chthonomonadaceae bacterium]|nr:TIGR04053 family radical SAM/SPASM domain-containing protein [Chthonomonadaceae bacterium]